MVSGQSMTLTGVGESTHRRGRHFWDKKALAVSVRLHGYTKRKRAGVSGNTMYYLCRTSRSKDITPPIKKKRILLKTLQ
jgi:hypothetical protein